MEENIKKAIKKFGVPGQASIDKGEKTGFQPIATAMKDFNEAISEFASALAFYTDEIRMTKKIKRSRLRKIEQFRKNLETLIKWAKCL